MGQFRALEIGIVFFLLSSTSPAESSPNCDDFNHRRGQWEFLPKWEERPQDLNLQSPEWLALVQAIQATSAGEEQELQILDTIFFCMEQNGVSGTQKLRQSLLTSAAVPEPQSTVIAPEDWEKSLDKILVSPSSPKQTFNFSAGNEIHLRVDAEEFQPDVLRIIRSAKSVIAISVLQFQPDRFGLVLATELIARLLGYNFAEGNAQSLADRRILFQKLWGTSLEALSLRLEADGTYDIFSWDLEPPMINWSATQKTLQMLLAEKSFQRDPEGIPQIFVFSDRFRVKPLGPLSDTPLFDTLKNAGVQITFITNNNSNKAFNAFISLFQKVIPIAGINHAKLIASENEALISGGNVQDKVAFVARTNPGSRAVQKWHDLAVNVRGPILKDLYQFFFQQFNNTKLTRSGEVPTAAIFKTLETTSKFQTQGKSRIITTTNSSPLPIANHGLHKSQTEKSFEFATKNAQQSIYIETPFFSDVWATSLLIRQAKKWKLSDVKKQRGEKFSHCGVDLDSLERKKIVVLIPKNMDQFAVKVAERGLIGFMVKAGIDVCRWSADVANKNVRSGDAKFVPKAMMHGKTWMVDERIAYVGSANINRRAMRGDLELGILSTDPEFVADLKKRVFVEDFKNSLSETKKLWNFLLLPVTIFWNAFNIT